MDSEELTRQLVIVHLTDIHFGEKHRFNPPRSASGDRPYEAGYPTLLEKLRSDLNREDPGCPVILCLTGDLVETADAKEFGQAEEFITQT
jgi:hypothetical protein